MTDVFDAVCDVCVVSRWVLGGLFMCTAGAVQEGAYGLERNR